MPPALALSASALRAADDLFFVAGGLFILWYWPKQVRRNIALGHWSAEEGGRQTRRMKWIAWTLIACGLFLLAGTLVEVK